MKDKLKELLTLFIAFSPVIIPVVIIVSILFLTEHLEKQESYKGLLLRELITIEYDGCEYVTNGLHKTNAVLVHKGNCKYCTKKKEGKHE